MTAVEFKPRDCFRADGAPKVPFVSRREAAQVARNLGNGTFPYRCSYCGNFHLGNRRQQ